MRIETMFLTILNWLGGFWSEPSGTESCYVPRYAKVSTLLQFTKEYSQIFKIAR